LRNHFFLSRKPHRRVDPLARRQIWDHLLVQLFICL
jgi:hypothetical protein